MEFPNRNVQPQTAASGAQQPASAGGSSSKKSRGSTDKGKLMRWAVIAIVAAVVILLGALIVNVASSNSIKSQTKYVTNDKLQAVFLNTGQVYFGNIQSINSQYMVLSNIYYLQTANNGTSSTTTSNSNVSLIKLGCELHAPYDQMVINTSQVTFWENLTSNGKVAQAVAAFQKQNPNGQQCSSSTGGASTSGLNSTQNANGGSSSTGTTQSTSKP